MKSVGQEKQDAWEEWNNLEQSSYEEGKRLKVEIEKKDKIIEAMAERIEWLAKSNGILLDKEHDENFTMEDIKQYFKNKVNSSE